MTLVDADLLLWPSVQATIDALELGPEGAAAAKGALLLALNIDAHTDKIYAMRWLMPELLKYLDALGATPDARARIKRLASGGGGDKPDATINWLDQQRQSRATRSAKRP